MGRRIDRLRVGWRAAPVALAIGLLGAAPAAAGSFEPAPLEVPQGKYFDLGVADVDSDSDLDLFSSNHQYPQLLQLNDGSGRFSAVGGAAGFEPSPAFPGLGDLFHPPRPEAPGLYIYARHSAVADPIYGQGQLVVETRDLPGGAKVLLDFVGRRVAPGSVEGARVVKGAGASGARIRVEAGANSLTVIRPAHLDLPIRVRVGEGTPLGATRVGSELVQPSDHRFNLRTRDRHGIAWADFNSDGSQDAFISNGGLGGEIIDYEEVVSDELLRGAGRRSPRFVDRYRRSGLDKGDCRGRAAFGLDHDGDGSVDLFQTCDAGSPRLALGDGAGRLDDRSGLLRAVGPRAQGPASRWLELDGRRGLELVVASDRALDVFGRDGNRIELASDLGGRHGGYVGGISFGDFDGDGDGDLIVGSGSGVTLYVNRGGSLRERDPRRFGLPGSGVSAINWVDFDNDGRLDLHAHPGGLWWQRPNGTFRRTRFLRLPDPAGEARSSWLDADANGTMEPVIVARRRPTTDWVARRFVNERRSRHWLEVDVGGPGGSATAYGARVRVHTGRGALTSWVGAAEGSRYSSGNNRVHFGLGGRSRVRSIAVRWPDGRRTRIRSPRINRVLEVPTPSGRTRR